MNNEVSSSANIKPEKVVYEPLSSEVLKRLGRCCKHYCQNCPWGFGKEIDLV